MRILHTADLHLGQVIYQYYERTDEHLHFFEQLHRWIGEYRPDALVVSGDVFDVQQPSAAVWKMFTEIFARIRRSFPELAIVIVAGNHDSASRLQSHSEVWDLAGVRVVGTPPPPAVKAETGEAEGWEEEFIVKLTGGFIITIPYSSGDRAETIRHLQEYVARRNDSALPVVMTGHHAVSAGEEDDPEIGNLRCVSLDRFGDGYDYLALGHIHKSATLGRPYDPSEETKTYPSPVARYSGSVLHVSDDEAYPHSVSLVDIDRRGGEVSITPLRIDQLRHFITFPPQSEEAFETEKKALKGLEKFIKANDRCYVRLRVASTADLPSDFNTKVYTLIESSGKDIRYNPKIIRVSPAEEEQEAPEGIAETIEVGELQQMASPLEFVKKTLDRYPDLRADELEDLFKEIEDELRAMNE